MIVIFAGIAQLVEQGFCKPKVRGSSPCAGTITNTGLIIDYMMISMVKI